MTFQEKMIYHQIHPLKLGVDISTSIVSTYFLWVDNAIGFLIVFLLPSVLATVVTVRFADLEPLKQSRLGIYVDSFMSRTIEGIRLGGQILIWISAWYNWAFGIFLGAVIILAAWLSGFLFISKRPI